MNVEELVRDSLRELAGEQTSARPGFADRVLAVRRRRRARRLASVAAATVAVVGVAVAVPLLDSGKNDVRPADVVQKSDVTAHPDQSPPRELISAGSTVLAAYYVPKVVKHSDDSAERVRDYWLPDHRTGRYVKTTKWSYVAVAPGLKIAAVLERNLPTSRIGLLDLDTGKIDRWIPVDHKVAGVSFSRDGLKLVATTYGENPDQLIKMEGSDGWDQKQPSSRTGFYVLDVVSGKGSWSEVKLGNDSDDPMGGFLNARQDFALSPDGRHVWAGNPMGDIGKQFYDLTGAEVAVPEDQKYLDWFVDAGQSPSGKFVAGSFAGEKWKTSSWVFDARTGKKTEVRGQQLLAWVGDTKLIAWDMAPNGKNEFHQRLVLVTVGSDKTVPLSGFRMGNDGDAGRWEPVFAER
ncbi:WD40 repeat domain-containing protein [Streptomyces sp. NPDC054940]